MKYFVILYAVLCAICAGDAASAAPLTGPEVAARCRDTYSSLQSFRQTVRATTNGQPTEAEITYVAPGRIRIEGTNYAGSHYSLIADGEFTWLHAGGHWQRENDTVTGVTACAQASGSVAILPGLLLKIPSADPFSAGEIDADVHEETISGRLTYHIRSVDDRVNYWVDEKSFFLVKCSTTANGIMNIELFGAPKRNVSIEPSVFAPPPEVLASALPT